MCIYIYIYIIIITHLLCECGERGERVSVSSLCLCVPFYFPRLYLYISLSPRLLSCGHVQQHVQIKPLYFYRHSYCLSSTHVHSELGSICQRHSITSNQNDGTRHTSSKSVVDVIVAVELLLFRFDDEFTFAFDVSLHRL